MYLGEWLAEVGSELAIAISDPDVWVASAGALFAGFLCLVIGGIVARFLGLVPGSAPSIEVIGVSLGVGLIVVTVAWATVRSGGSSSFTPIAVLVLAALLAAVARRDQRPFGLRPQRGRDQARRFGPALVGCAVLVLALGLMYGALMTPSARHGVQPVEFLDEAFYSVLGRDLASSGVETIYSPAGFPTIPGFPPQTWYHWGELWLTAATISHLGLDPIDARHYVVLPLLLLACVCLTTTLVRRLTGIHGPGIVIFSAFMCLFMAPLPLSGTHFGSWARGLVFGITMYGLAAAIVLLVIYRLVLPDAGPRTLARSIFDGALVASLIPAHIVIAALSLAGFLVTATLTQLRSRRAPWPIVPQEERPLLAWATAGAVACIAWGIATGHGIGTSGLSESVGPFNESWVEAVLVVLVGGLPFLAIVLAWPLVRGTRTELLLGTALFATVIGAIGWGARLGDFTSFHFFYAPIAVLLTPAAAVALVLLWRDLRSRKPSLAFGVVAVCVLWLDIGLVTSVIRLQEFGAKLYPPTPTAILDAMADLPDGATVAYACQPGEELAVWNPRMGSLDAHSGHHVVPMCFQAEFFPSLTGVPVDGRTMSPLFEHAPQRELYPALEATPSPATVEQWMRRHGVEYIYADELHPNSLIPDARLIAESGPFRLYALP